MSENTMNNLKIGVDVGGTKIEAVLVDAMGTVLGSARIPARHGNDAVIEDIVAVAHQAAGERFDEVRAIGVGTPGTVDSASGHVGNIVNLDVVSLDMGPLISQRSGVPGTIAFLNFGTGLAAGIVENGVLMHGYSGAAGEIGHIPVEPHRLKCPCGQYGCLETVCSGASVGRLWPNADPRLIDLGGGMAKTGEPLVEVITAELRRRESQCRFLETLDLPARLRLAPVDQPVGAIGAAMAA